MHKDRLKVSIECQGEEGADSVLSDFAGSINGVNQWRVERTNDNSDYEVTVWKSSGLDHVSIDGKFEEFVEEEDRVLSGSVEDYWKNI